MDLNRKSTGFVIKNIFIIFLFVLSCGKSLAQEYDSIARVKWVAFDENTGEIVLSWEKVNLPGVKEYIVNYRTTSQTPGALQSYVPVPIQAFPASAQPVARFSPNILDHADINATPVVFAVDVVFNNDSLNLFHALDLYDWDSTIFVNQAVYDTCSGVLNLSWTPYNFNMWDYGLKGYRIYVSQNNGPYSIYKTYYVESGQLTNLIPDNNYSVFIAAIPGRPGLTSDSATSPVIHINTFRARLPEYIYADNATINDVNAEVNFTIDSLSELTTFNLLRSTSPNGPYDSIIQLSPVNNKISYIDRVDYLAGPYYYKLDAINFCKISVLTSENAASTIVLENSGAPLTPDLSWNDYYNWINGVSQYTVERKFGNNFYEDISSSLSTTFTDDLEALKNTGVDASVCYRVVARGNPNPDNISYSSESNEICYELPLNIHFDFDAFIPGAGTGNDSFGPTIDYLPDEFEFDVLDRSGNVVYQTTDPLNCRWDGITGNSLAPAGAYMAIVKYRNKGGKWHIIRSGVAVVYP